MLSLAFNDSGGQLATNICYNDQIQPETTEDLDAKASKSHLC